MSSKENDKALAKTVKDLVATTDSHIKSPRLCIAIRNEVNALVSRYDKHVRELNDRIGYLRDALEKSQAKLQEADEKLRKIFGDDDNEEYDPSDEEFKAMFTEWKERVPVV